MPPALDIGASAENIPCPDKEFDLVTSIDMMKHIPQSIRMKVLREFIGVARHAVIIIAPQDTAENKQVEEMVLKYENNRFLIEHRQHILDDFNALKKIRLLSDKY